MGRVLTLILAVFWTVVFGHAAMAWIAELARLVPPFDSAGLRLLLDAFTAALVSSLFLWLAITAIAVAGPEDMADLAAIAVAGACAVATIRIAWHGTIDTAGMMQLPGLLVTYLAVVVASGRVVVEGVRDETVMRRMASEAASMAILSGNLPSGTSAEPA